MVKQKNAPAGGLTSAQALVEVSRRTGAQLSARDLDNACRALPVGAFPPVTRGRRIWSEEHVAAVATLISQRLGAGQAG